MDSNHRPPGYEPDALTNWAKGPELPLLFNSNIFFILVQEIFAFLHEKNFIRIIIGEEKMYKAKKLPFLYYQLEPTISAKTNAYHYEKHYKTYLNNPNKIIIKNNISINYELYFESIKEEKKLPDSNLLLAINNSFGNLDNMYNEIKNCTRKLKGSGYLFLVTDNNKKLSSLITTNQDSPYLYELTPLLCIDLWEHTYCLEYQNERNRYVEEILKMLNFSYANKLFANWHT